MRWESKAVEHSVEAKANCVIERDIGFQYAGIDLTMNDSDTIEPTLHELESRASAAGWNKIRDDHIDIR